MSDLIDRQAAIDLFESFPIEKVMSENPLVAVSVILLRQNIALLPPACPPVHRWVACREKLPETDGIYLVTFAEGFNMGFDNTMTEINDSEENPNKTEIINYGVTAWMNMPEPHKGI